MDKLINTAFKKHFKCTPDLIKSLKGGEQAKAYLAEINNEKYCIKFNKTYEGKSIMQMEMNTMNEAKRLGVITPKPLYCDKIQDKSQEYLIMTYINSILLEDVWGKLDGSEKKYYIKQILDIHNKISQIPTTGFGPIDENFVGASNSFEKYIQSEIDIFCKSEISTIISDKLRDKVFSLLGNFSNSQKIKLSYVHADIRLRNFFVSHKKLILFDFANAMSMDKTFDFIRFATTDLWQNNEIRKYAIDLYKNKYYLRNNYELDENIYNLLLTLRLLPWLYKNSEQKYVKEYIEKMKFFSDKLSKQLL